MTQSPKERRAEMDAGVMLMELQGAGESVTLSARAGNKLLPLN